MDQYDYKELCGKALAFDATQKDINALGEWFHVYGMNYWNGENFYIDPYHVLFPIYKEVDYDDFEVIGYTFSSEPENRMIMRDMTEEEREAEAAAWAKACRESAKEV